MIGQTIACAREECKKEFVKTTHNMKYCCSDCTRIATNAKIMQNYHENAAIRRGKKRLCSVCGITSLSRYNPNKMCGGCETKVRENNTDAVAELVQAVSWL